MKSKVTRTYGPIHFEDLDPHRFEDLIRELIYDYKNWQSIEATGRGGGDDGFDIRAYEKVEIVSQVENENGEVAEEGHPMEGNLWMIQGKREKEIGPKKLQEILTDIDEKNPPYGYILAASTNLSKKSYDVFREELIKKGVMEFYLWSKAELEDMLHFPKNDRILFTFFGVSLVSKRRSRTTEIRSVVNIKNKLYRILGEAQQFYRHILIRDLKDTHYPYKEEYKDFEKKPRWREYIAFDYHSLGLLCHSHEYLAYIDTEKKEWDYIKVVDQIHPQEEDFDERKARAEKQQLVNDTYDFLPKNKQGRLVMDRLVKYADIELVDEKGDRAYQFPHLYVDFIGDRGPFSGGYDFLKRGGEDVGDVSDYKQIKVFPERFKKQKIGKVYKDKKIVLDANSLRNLNDTEVNIICDSDGKYSFLKSRDIISIAAIEQESYEQSIQITHKCSLKAGDYIKQRGDDFRIRVSINLQLGRVADEKEEVNIYEFKRVI